MRLALESQYAISPSVNTRWMKRSPCRWIASAMRGTSAISMPLPTIMRIYVSTELQQSVATIDHTPINHPRFSHQLMRFCDACSINVLHFLPVRHQPVRNQHAMAMKIDSLSTHI